MAKHVLTNGLEREFTFEIDGREFTFRKPTVREMRKISQDFQLVQGEESPERQLELSDRAMAGLYNNITPLNHNDNIKDVMDDQPMGVQVAFNEMIQEELGAN